jgi:hypothetical protein
VLVSVFGEVDVVMVPFSAVVVGSVGSLAAVQDGRSTAHPTRPVSDTSDRSADARPRHT